MRKECQIKIKVVELKLIVIFEAGCGKQIVKVRITKCAGF